MQDHDDELDDMAEELSAMGVANADDWADAQREDDDDPEETCVVWPENAAAFQVFIHCTWERAALPDGRLVPTGIAAAEIRATAQLLDVPRADWPALLDDVRFMASAVLPGLQRL